MSEAEDTMCVRQLSCEFDNVSSSYVKVCYQLFLAADLTSGVKIKFFLNAPARLPINTVSTLEDIDAGQILRRTTCSTGTYPGYKPLGVFLLSPVWDFSLSQGCASAVNSPVPTDTA